MTLLAQLRRTNRTQVDGALMGCQVTGWELTTAAWVRTQDLPITDDQRASMPANCWRKGDP